MSSRSVILKNIDNYDEKTRILESGFEGDRYSPKIMSNDLAKDNLFPLTQAIKSGLTQNITRIRGNS